MPLFEYQCLQCKKNSEILVRGEETPECPECGSTKLEKQASQFAPMSGSQPAPSPQCAGCPSGGCPMQGMGG